MPECRKSLDRNIPSADEIGVAHVIASDTSEYLCLAVAPVLLTTFGACPGGASRIDRNGPNTVLRRQTFDPLSHPPIHPRGGGYAKIPTSRFGFAGLQTVQVFEPNGLKTVPRQLFDRAVDIAVARDPGAPLGFAAGRLRTLALTVFQSSPMISFSLVTSSLLMPTSMPMISPV